MERQITNDYIRLEMETPIWNRFFTVAPLIVVGSKEGDGYDLAPKHMATPLGHKNYFGFVCTPNHSTYHNIKIHREFSVSFPLPDQTILAALSATPRCGPASGNKEIIKSIPTLKTTKIDALFVEKSYLYLECELYKIVDGFDEYSLISGKVVATFVHKDYLRVSEKDEQEQIYRHPILAYLAHGRFAEITQTYNFPYPKDFKL